MSTLKGTIAKATVAGVFLAVLTMTLVLSLAAPHVSSPAVAPPAQVTSSDSTPSAQPNPAEVATITVGKGLAISSAYIVGSRSGAPSFEQLQQAHFTLIGTVAYSSFNSDNWRQLAIWITAAHKAGFTTFIDYWAEDSQTAADLTYQAASTGTDIVALDELLSNYKFTETQLKATIDVGLKVNPKLSFVLNEFSVTDIQNAYAWTASYPSVTIATDNYYAKSVIDIGIQQASIYGKRPAAWLIFSKGSQDFDSYTHLNDWISYAKQKNIDTYFWIVDQAGTWSAQWQQVAAF